MNEEEYQKWRARQQADERPDLKCLHDFLFVVQQYLEDQDSLAAQGVMRSAIACIERWVSDEYAQMEGDT